MRRYAVLGHPIKHSLSPAMQQSAFAHARIEAVYERLDVPPDAFTATVALLRTTHAGWNVTIPHKAAMAAAVDEISREARLADSVNTVINKEGRLHGHSTDGHGLRIAAMEALGADPAREPAFFIGAGGAARACAVHLALLGCPAIGIFNRSRAAAEQLADILREAAPACSVCVWDEAKLKERPQALSGYQFLIQSTSLGLQAQDASPIDFDLLLDHHKVYDMIYRDTALQQHCRQRGLACSGGLGMLLHQGALAWSAWTGLEAPIETMRRALSEAARGQA